jgi:hypothetical protein
MGTTGKRVFTRLIHQGRLDAIVRGLARTDPRAAARYPQPPDFWEGFLPPWVTARYEGDLVIVSVTGYSAARDSLDRFLSGILAEAVIQRREAPARTVAGLNARGSGHA